MTGRLYALFIVCVMMCSACATVKPYQRAYLNDHEMRIGKKDIEKFEDNAHTYREGASGGGAKSGGGCGCN